MPAGLGVAGKWLYLWLATLGKASPGPTPALRVVEHQRVAVDLHGLPGAPDSWSNPAVARERKPLFTKCYK